MKFQLLDEDGIRGIHETAVSMLETIGMDVAGDAPRATLLEAGARTRDGRIVIGQDVVDRALSQVPARGFELVGRDGTRRFRVVAGEVRFRPAGGLPFVVDCRTGERRPATMQDAETMVRVADALDGIDVSNSSVSPAEFGVGIKNVRRFVASIAHSTKPADITASGPDEVAAVGEIAQIIRGDSEALRREPLALVYVSPTSPLRLSESEGLATMQCARRGLPLGLLSCPTLAATAPATMAGAVAQEWAEELAMMVLAYAVCPGLPVVACSRLNPIDMRRGNAILSGAIPGLATAALAEVAASFNLPANGWGFATSGHTADLQAGAERMLGTLLAALSGTNVISGAGALDNALACAPEQLVIDNELISVVRDALRGVAVSPTTLAADSLAEGVAEGTFMASDSTIEYLHSGEMWRADLFSAEPHEVWTQQGGDLVGRARGRVDEILRTHEVPPLEPAQVTEIEAVLAAAGA